MKTLFTLVIVLFSFLLSAQFRLDSILIVDISDNSLYNEYKFGYDNDGNLTQFADDEIDITIINNPDGTIDRFEFMDYGPVVWDFIYNAEGLDSITFIGDYYDEQFFDIESTDNRINRIDFGYNYDGYTELESRFEIKYDAGLIDSMLIYDAYGSEFDLEGTVDINWQGDIISELRIGYPGYEDSYGYLANIDDNGLNTLVNFIDYQGLDTLQVNVYDSELLSAGDEIINPREFFRLLLLLSGGEGFNEENIEMNSLGKVNMAEVVPTSSYYGVNLEKTFYYSLLVNNEETPYYGELIAVSPNPVQNVITFRGHSDLNRCEIINSSGQVILQGNLNNNSFDVSSLADGLYTIVAFDVNNKMYLSRFVKK